MYHILFVSLSWEQRKLEDIASLITKGTTPKDKSGDGEINFIKVENIDSLSGEIKDCSKISIEEHEGYLKRSQLKENDILFSIAGTLGRTTIVNKRFLPANTNQALAILRMSEGDISYIVTVLKGRSVSDFVRRNPTIGAQPNLSLEQVSNLEIPYPNIEEQVKIGEFFSDINNLITLHQRDKYISLCRKLYIHYFYPCSWEQRKLEDIGEIITGTTPPTKDKDNYGGTRLFVSPADIQGNRYVTTTNTTLTDKGYSLGRELRGGTSLFVSIGSTIGKVAQIKDSATSNQQINAVVPYTEMDDDFVFSMLENASDKIKKLSAQQAVPIINKTTFGDIEINHPKKDEQTKIGLLFSDLDNLITLHQRKLLYNIFHGNSVSWVILLSLLTEEHIRKTNYYPKASIKYYVSGIFILTILGIFLT